MKITLVLLLIASISMSECSRREPKAQARLNAKFEMFEKCKKKTGKLGRVAEMVYSNNDQPVTIKSKQSYVELDTDKLALYVDEFKTELYKQIKLIQISQITIPKSFQQPGYEVNCFQVQSDKYHVGKIKVDQEKEEPFLASEVDLTLCFRDAQQLKDWLQAIIDFYQNCGVKRNNVDENEGKEEQPETLIQVENKIKTLIDTAYALSKEFEVIKKQREYQEKIQKEAQAQEEAYQKEKKEKFEKVRKQTPIDNMEYGTAKDCTQVESERKEDDVDEERRKLAEVKEEADIDMSDIDTQNDLTEEEKQKKREKRIALFKTMQQEATAKKARLQKNKYTEVKEEDSQAEATEKDKDNSADLEPIK